MYYFGGTYFGEIYPVINSTGLSANLSGNGTITDSLKCGIRLSDLLNNSSSCLFNSKISCKCLSNISANSFISDSLKVYTSLNSIISGVGTFGINNSGITNQYGNCSFNSSGNFIGNLFVKTKLNGNFSGSGSISDSLKTYIGLGAITSATATFGINNTGIIDNHGFCSSIGTSSYSGNLFVKIKLLSNFSSITNFSDIIKVNPIIRSSQSCLSSLDDDLKIAIRLSQDIISNSSFPCSLHGIVRSQCGFSGIGTFNGRFVTSTVRYSIILRDIIIINRIEKDCTIIGGMYVP